MSSPKKAVCFLCKEPNIDPVSSRAFNVLPELFPLVEAGFTVDDTPVRKHIDESGNEFYFVGTYRVVCHDYKAYLPVMNLHFSNFDMAGLVTWHEGENAPDKVLTVHTTGDVTSGIFGNANPRYMRNLLLSLEKNRVVNGLEDFRITTEATHWSGVIYSEEAPVMIRQFPVPIVDIEIGSTYESWSNSLAVRALTKSLVGFFDDDGKKLKNLLCVGGVHFETGFANVILQTWDDFAFGISHILANQWLVSGNYEGEEGLEKLESCLGSIQGQVTGFAIHDNLKGVYKEQIRVLGRKHNVPVFKHQLLRRPVEIPWTE